MTSLLIPEDNGILVPVADQGWPPPANDVQADVFPTPAEAAVGDEAPPPPAPMQAVAVPDLPSIDVGQQQAAQPNAADFIVTGAGNFQTNTAEVDPVLFVVTAVTVLANPVRYVLGLERDGGAPAALDSFGLSLAGREMEFDEGTLTTVDANRTRPIQAFGASSIIVGQQGDGQDLVQPQAGDALYINTDREAAEAVNDQVATPANVNVSTSTQPVQGAADVHI